MSTVLREQLQTRLGTDYAVEQELGGAGMSRVFVASDVALGRWNRARHASVQESRVMVLY